MVLRCPWQEALCFQLLEAVSRISCRLGLGICWSDQQCQVAKVGFLESTQEQGLCSFPLPVERRVGQWVASSVAIQYWVEPCSAIAANLLAMAPIF